MISYYSGCDDLASNIAAVGNYIPRAKMNPRAEMDPLGGWIKAGGGVKPKTKARYYMHALFLRRTETGTKSAALNELFTRLSTSGMS